MILPLGRQLAEAGMAQTLEAEGETWVAKALQQLQRFAKLPGWGEFRAEDFRAWYLAQGLPEPHDHHVWGAFMTRASKAHVVRFTGRYGPSVSPKTRGHYVRIWTLA